MQHIDVERTFGFASGTLQQKRLLDWKRASCSSALVGKRNGSFDFWIGNGCHFCVAQKLSELEKRERELAQDNATHA